MKACRARAGFTLLEILVVVMIITILATIVGVKVAQEPGRARVAVARAQIQVFKTALERYRLIHGAYPTQEQGLNALCQVPTREPIPRDYPDGGYLDRAAVPLDPWGNDYVYLIPAPADGAYELVSYGADGEPGGVNEAADLELSKL